MAGKENDYSMSFIAASLCYPESRALAEAYAEERDWQKVKERAVRENLLQKSSASTIRRVVPELILRLRHLSDTQLDVFLAGSDDSARLILWLAICKTYPYFREFGLEVLNEKFRTYAPGVELMDVREFYDGKAIEHPKLQEHSLRSRDKIISMTLLIPRQAGILGSKNEFVYIYFSPEVEACLTEEHPVTRRIYPA